MCTARFREDLERLLGTVDDVMERTVVVLARDQSIAEAALELERRGVSGAPVLHDDKVVGVISLRDIFRAAGIAPEQAATAGPWHRYEHHLSHKTTVGEAMTATVMTLPLGSPVAEAAAIMRERKVNRIPIVDAQGLVRGIVARDDVIEAVARASMGLRRRTTKSGSPSMEPD